MANAKVQKAVGEAFERHLGRIHERVKLEDGDITVMAGEHASDSLFMIIDTSGTSYSIHISAGVAARLGRLLVAAAADTESR